MVTEEVDCASCGEGDEVNPCDKSQRKCGHHCNHIWTHDKCCWCGVEAEVDTETLYFTVPESAEAKDETDPI